MKLTRYVLALALASATSAFAVGLPQDTQSAKQDMKDAGHETKNAAKDAGSATKKTTKKATHKTAKKAKQGAQKVEDKTDSSK